MHLPGKLGVRPPTPTGAWNVDFILVEQLLGTEGEEEKGEQTDPWALLCGHGCPAPFVHGNIQ